MARAPIENQLLLMFWMMVMQASAIYDYMRQHYHNRILHRAPHRNWRAERIFKHEINNLVEVGLGGEDALEEAHPTHSSTANTSNETAQGRGRRAKRKRGKLMDDAASALKIIAQTSQQIAIAFKKQATQQSHVNVQAILDKVRGFGLVDGDVTNLMQIFVHDEEEGRFFLEINDETFLRGWVNRKLGK